MTAYYFETSAFVKRFAVEKGTAFVLSLFRARQKNLYYASQLTEVEVFAALAKRRKGKTLTALQVSKAQRRFIRDYTDSFFQIVITNAIVKDAVRLADLYALRGYDAVQLASALAANQNRIASELTPLVLVSADNELNDAAQAEGLIIENPNDYP